MAALAAAVLAAPAGAATFAYDGDALRISGDCAARTRLTILRAGTPVLRRDPPPCRGGKWTLVVHGNELGRGARFGYRLGRSTGAFARVGAPAALYPVAPVPADAAALVAGVAISRADVAALLGRSKRPLDLLRRQAARELVEQA